VSACAIADNAPVSEAYAASGVDTRQADRGVAALVEVLRGIEPGRSSRVVALPGHYASIIRLTPDLGIALATDSVGSKAIVAEQLARFDTIGIDCVAMNVNDLICVGAEPLALLDYIAVEHVDPDVLAQIATGLLVGAEAAGVEIPGGEVCQLPEVIRGHPSPLGFDLVGSAFGTVSLNQIVDGSRCRPGDALIGLPSSGVHSNGLSLARRALLEEGGLSLESKPTELSGRTVGDALLEPTTIYVRAILELLASDVDVHGLAHITGGGVLNLLRIGSGIGYLISRPLPVPAIFPLIAAYGNVPPEEMWEVFNMGCGFCVMVAAHDSAKAVELLRKLHRESAVIGRLTEDPGKVKLPGLVGDSSGLTRT
jgi:phosphoribosylformylglycinamidine cyclo-ligase